MHHSRIFRSSAGALAVVSVAVQSHAQSASAAREPIVTDRPDFTEATDAVGAHTFQLEAGVGTFTIAGTAPPSKPAARPAPKASAKRVSPNGRRPVPAPLTAAEVNRILPLGDDDTTDLSDF
jgi:hypothetical protein